MTTDLWYLACTAMLTAALWIPYIVCQVMTNGALAPANYVDPAPRPIPLWGQRAHRAYLNAVECFAPFAALVIVAQVGREGERDDRFLGDELFLAEAGARRRLLGGDPVPENGALHLGLPVRRRDFLGGDQVGFRQGRLGSVRADEGRPGRTKNRAATAPGSWPDSQKGRPPGRPFERGTGCPVRRSTAGPGTCGPAHRRRSRGQRSRSPSWPRWTVPGRWGSGHPWWSEARSSTGRPAPPKSES